MVIVRENAGPIIRRRRRERELSQRDIAGAVGCSATYLSEIERGIRFGSMEILTGACRVLDLPAPKTSLELVEELDRLQTAQQ